MTLSEPRTDSPVYAAGALVWRESAEGVQVLLIHREHHGDYSLPKGKVDPGESLPETAVRELWEETGYRLLLGASLGKIDYDLPSGRPKEVYYWSCEVTEDQWHSHRFIPNDEVDELSWVPLSEAQERLTYERDRDVVAKFAARYEAGAARTFPVILLRHAKAVAAKHWPGSDESRPLTSRGQAQSEHLAPILRAFDVHHVLTSTAVRCRATVSALVTDLEINPVSDAQLSQSAAPLDGDLRQLLDESLAPQAGVVICSHSPVLPSLVDALADATHTARGTIARQGLLSTAEAAVFHVPLENSAYGIVATETHGPSI